MVGPGLVADQRLYGGEFEIIHCDVDGAEYPWPPEEWKTEKQRQTVNENGQLKKGDGLKMNEYVALGCS
jgi:hypothetical protein